MKKRHKIYLKLNMISVVFIVISFISVTLAWFAYSGLAKVNTEVGIKAWYIELEKNGESVSNDIVISLSDIYPGMDTVNEIIKIKNKGDSDAMVKYSITSARILANNNDNYIVNDQTIKSDYVEDVISHNYPFKLNVNLSKGYALSKGEESIFEVSVSWPLDSGNDKLDSMWGTEAYKFHESEKIKKINNPEYQTQSSIQIVISLTAEQYLNDFDTSDPKYNLGDIIMYDVINNVHCDKISPTCIKTYVADVNNKLGDDVVKLLPNPIDTYPLSLYEQYDEILNNQIQSWNVTTRPLFVEDAIRIVSTDILESYLIRENISPVVIGNMNFPGRFDIEFPKMLENNGYYQFLNSKFSFLTAANCYWLKSSTDNIALKKKNDDFTNIYKENSNQCKVIPLILANKINL